MAVTPLNSDYFDSLSASAAAPFICAGTDDAPPGGVKAVTLR